MTYSSTKFDLWVIIVRLAYGASSATEALQERIYKSIAEMLKRHLSEWNSAEKKNIHAKKVLPTHQIQGAS